MKELKRNRNIGRKKEMKEKALLLTKKGQRFPSLQLSTESREERAWDPL